jgi:hypothetical protein
LPHLAEIRTPIPMECRGDDEDGLESRRCSLISSEKMGRCRPPAVANRAATWGRFQREQLL